MKLPDSSCFEAEERDSTSRTCSDSSSNHLVAYINASRSLNCSNFPDYKNITVEKQGTTRNCILTILVNVTLCFLGWFPECGGQGTRDGGGSGGLWIHGSWTWILQVERAYQIVYSIYIISSFDLLPPRRKKRKEISRIQRTTSGFAKHSLD